jgi:hypothetical protein
MSYATSSLVRCVNELPAGTPVTLVQVDRYTVPIKVGLHLLSPATGGRFPYRQQIIGLVPLEPTLNQVLAVFHQCEEDEIGSSFFADQTADLQAYIRAQVIPLEWKSLSDIELGRSLFVRHGVARQITAEVAL